MAKIEIDMSELLEYGTKLKDKKRIDTLMRDSTKAIGKFFRDDVESRTPVKTGRLRESWSKDNPFVVVKTGSTYEIEHENQAFNPTGEGAYYASFVENGHYSVRGNWVEEQHFMYDAEAETERNAPKLVDKEVLKWKRWVDSGS